MSNDIQTGVQRVITPAVDARQSGQAAAVTAARVAEAVKPVAVAQPDPQEVRRSLQEAAERLNKQMTRSSRDLSFSVDDVANTVVITVKNRDSGEVIRQIPSEVALRVAHNLEDVKGLLQDKNT